MKNKFSLVFNAVTETTGTAGTSMPKPEVKLEYNDNGGRVCVAHLGDIVCNLILCEFNYVKEIYRPGALRFKVELDWESDNAPQMSTIYSTFGGRSVMLTNNEFHIADNYYVFDIQLEKLRTSSNSMYVTFQAFSPDKFLTLDKYCKAYTGRKFIQDILANSSVWPDNLPPEIKIEELLVQNPRFLTYESNGTTEQKKEEDNKQNETDGQKTEATNTGTEEQPQEQKEVTMLEYIQPYLVQYNESFFDFLVRITNRCGEFFYYENGNFHIGWKPSDPVSIADYVSFRFTQGQTSAWKGSSLAETHKDYVQDKDLSTSERAIMKKDSDLASDENLACIPPKSEYTTWSEFALFPGTFLITLASEMLGQKNIFNMLDYAAWKIMLSGGMNNLSATANDGYETKNFTGPYKDERQVGDNDNAIIYLYSSKPNTSASIAYNLNFYTNIQKGIEEAERSRIHIELGNHFSEVSLGSVIQLENESERYIVVKIESGIHVGSGQSVETLDIEAIPYSENATVYPPSARVSLFRLANAQRAVVTSNEDPLKMNRIRVRYPWQAEADDSTPWIRIALPMASDGCGFSFLPNIGDEAIVNFENGNIERPYVEDMLFSGQKQPARTHLRATSRSITSANGHSIIFSDPPSSSNFFKSFFPAMGTITGFCPGAMTGSIPESDLNKAMGGIEFTDEFGFYSISMSSDRRAISINSPLGAVSMNAFTGITISAPNGNIKIAGKNIDIVAGNNLSITSGTNRTPFWPFYEKGQNGKGAIDRIIQEATAFAGRFAIVDMNLMRTIMESFLRPVGGTLLIKSNRYLCMEAGKGKANIWGRAYIQSRWGSTALSAGGNLVPFGLSKFLDLKDVEYNVNDKVYQDIKKISDALKFVECDYHEKVVRCEKNKKEYANCLTQENKTRLKNLKEIADIFNAAKNNQGYQDVELSEDVQSKENDLTTIETVNNLGQIFYYSATQICYDTYWNQLSQKNIDSLNTYRTDVEEILDLINLYKATDYSYPGRDVAASMKLKRKLMFKALKDIVKKYCLDNNLGIKLPDGEPGDYTTEKWNAYVNGIRVGETTDRSKALVNKIVSWGNYALNIGFQPFQGFLDQYAWSKTDEGDILFAPQKGVVLNFKDKTLHDYTGAYDENAKLNDLKNLLKGIE